MTIERGDPEERQRQERECYVILQHAYVLAQAETGVRLNAAQIAEDLGYTRREALPLFDRLRKQGLLVGHATEGPLSLTPMGIDYLERVARRRKSVRAEDSGSAPAEHSGPLGDALVTPG